jgi:RNA polymerase sigma-70 factor (ECF subfamily)
MRYAYSLTTDKDNAKDLVQETFLKALKYCDKFIHETNFKAWTYTIMKNTFINNYRRSARYSTISDQTKDGFYLNYSHSSGSDTPDRVYASKEIEKIIEALDDNFKLPFKMHHEGFKYREIAEKLDLNLGTIKSRIFFARKKLIKQLNS